MKLNEEQIKERLANGQVAEYESYAVGYVFRSDGASIPCKIKNHFVEKLHLARVINGDKLIADTPAEYEMRQLEAEQAAAQRKTARLQRWRKLILDSANNEVLGETKALDAAIETVANEAMSLGSLED